MSLGQSALASVRLTHSATCLTVLRSEADALTISELAAQTGLSRPTVEAVLADLEQTGLVVVDDPAPGQGAGRPARRLAYAAGAGVIVAVDAGPHTLRMIMTDLAGEVLWRETRDLDGPLDDQARLAALIGCADEGLAAIGQTRSSVQALGLAVAGILDTAGRLASSLAVPEWVGLDLAETLQDAFGCPVVLENDIKLAAWAESRHESVRDLSPLAFLQIGHRISLALIMDGMIVQGSHRVAGELGSLRGMTWTSTSVRGQLRWSTGQSAAAVFDRAATGDAAAHDEITTFCAEIAPKIATLALTIDPTMIIIGGGLSLAGDQLLRPLTRAVHHLLMISDKPPLIAARLSADGAVIGALGLAFRTWATDVLGLGDLEPPWSAWPAGDVHPARLARRAAS